MTLTLHHWPLQERPRERLLKHGPQQLSDTELLAIILRSGTRGFTVLELAGHDAETAAPEQFGAWAPLLLGKWLPLEERMKAFKIVLVSSVIWVSSIWRLATTQEKHLGSRVGRNTARIHGIEKSQNLLRSKPVGLEFVPFPKQYILRAFKFSKTR